MAFTRVSGTASVIAGDCRVTMAPAELSHICFITELVDDNNSWPVPCPLCQAIIPWVYHSALVAIPGARDYSPLKAGPWGSEMN